ncbi:MAG: trypsin-like peptidase domain-containing protein [Coriobacteriia bacterium]|nr:trypsin-like peptidase domain-containing protein [Coriobacteriia bacterium]
MVALAVALLAGSLAGGAAGFAGGLFAANRVRPQMAAQGGRALPVDGSEPVAAAAAQALPSVVNIDVSGSPDGARGEDEEDMPGGHPGVPIVGNGSGVAFRRTGGGGTYILTNNHVVENANSIIVKGMDRERHKGKLVGADPDTDVAVVQVDAELPVIEVADPDEVHVGELVIAIGSPFGLSHSVTSGVISAIGRSLPDSFNGNDDAYPLVDVIQTDAAINPGNSGGALVDRSGRLVGINTAIYSENGASGGIGFAIPAGSAIRVADQLIADGRVSHPFLGIVGQSVDPLIAREESLPVSEGALVVEIQKGTAAEKAGVKPGDLIVGIDGTKVRTMDDLMLEVRRRGIGEKVQLRVYRGGSQTTLEMTVGVKPADGGKR